MICQLLHEEEYIMTKITLTKVSRDTSFRLRTKRYLGGYKKVLKLLFNDLVKKNDGIKKNDGKMKYKLLQRKP